MAKTQPQDGEDEALRTDREAAAKLDQVTAPPATVTKLRRKGPKPPSGLGEQVIEFGATLTGVSIGKPIANVQATLQFNLDIPQPGIGELMGEHAYSGVFAGGFLGEGVFLKETPLKTDPENRVVQTLKVTLPRFDSAMKDQIERCIFPLITSDQRVLDSFKGLLAIEGSWRLNLPVAIPGALRLHRQQETFDLTKKATTEAEDAVPAAFNETVNLTDDDGADALLPN